MKNIMCLAAFVMMSIALVFGFQGSALGAEKINFAVVTGDQIQNAPAMIIRDKKLLEAEGIDVNWSHYMNGGYLVQHFASGEADVGSCGGIPVLIAASQKIDVVMIAGSSADGDSFVVHDYIKSVKDINGKKIATGGAGTVPSLLLDIIEKKYNVKVVRRSVALPDSPIYFKQKEVDGVLGPEPFSSQALLGAGTGHVLMDPKDIYPGHQNCVLFTTRKMIKERPDTVRKVMRAYKKALDFIIANPKEAHALMAKYTGVDIKAVENSFPTVKYPYPPFLNVESLKFFAENLQSSGKITKDAFTDVNEWIKTTYDESFARELWKK